MAQKLEDSKLLQLNLQNLQKQEDKSIKEVLGNASHTTLYRFDNTTCQWDRVGVEGTTFIVLAETAPIARLIVLNKLDVQNYTLDLSQVNKVKLQPPYLMLRLHANNKHKIMGLWFHDDDERAAMKDAMERAMAQAPPPTAATTAAAVTPPPVATTKQVVSISKVEINNQTEEYSMESMSQSTTLFHDQTHKDGAPIELDNTLPNNFKNKKETQTQAQAQAQPVVTVSGGGGGGKMKGLALLNSLKSNNTSSSDGGDLPTDYAITTSAQTQSQSKTQTQSQKTQSKKVAGGAKVASTRVEKVNNGGGKKSNIVLYAPSDITGVRRRFLKQ